MEKSNFKSPHVMSECTSLEINQERDIQRVLTIETDLYLNCEHPLHDQCAVDALLGEIQEKMGPDVFDRAELKEISRA